VSKQLASEPRPGAEDLVTLPIMKRAAEQRPPLYPTSYRVWSWQVQDSAQKVLLRRLGGVPAKPNVPSIFDVAKRTV